MSIVFEGEMKPVTTVEDALKHFISAAAANANPNNLSHIPLPVHQALVDRADSAYYRQGLIPLMTDAEYDYVKSVLKHRAPDDERLTRVGVPYDAAEMRNKVKHTFPMGSLDNTDGGINGFRAWYDGVCAVLGYRPAISISHKVDGASVRARYENGRLVQVATRGNGAVGEDITANGANFKGLPTILNQPVTCDVRGEAILFKQDFRDICERDHGCKFEEIEVDQLSNPRNIGNGILGRSNGLDSNLIRFMAFNLVMDHKFETHSEKLEHMEQFGFSVVQNTVCKTPEDVKNEYDYFAKQRDGLQYEIDGLVVVLDPIAAQEAFITDDVKSQLRPKHSRAIKFPNKSNTTIIEGVLLTVGHTGAIIPTAQLREVRVGGVNVTHALLNNWDEIGRLGIAIGDEVTVFLAGDIIPKCGPVVSHAGPEAIYRCPECGFEGTKKEQESHHAIT